jgi:hypothetical protein
MRASSPPIKGQSPNSQSFGRHTGIKGFSQTKLLFKENEKEFLLNGFQSNQRKRRLPKEKEKESVLWL